MLNRPQYSELKGKLKFALACFEEDGHPRVFIEKKTVKPQIAANIKELNLESSEAYWKLIIRCLTKAALDPEQTYRGSYPPQKVTKVRGLQGKEMWPFTVYDKNLAKHIYTKFCIKKMPDGIQYYAHVTCHECTKS